MSAETVKLHISIQIDTENECDTEMTVEAWNALTEQERNRIANDLWSIEATNADGGGMRVLTEGAEEI